MKFTFGWTVQTLILHSSSESCQFNVWGYELDNLLNVHEGSLQKLPYAYRNLSWKQCPKGRPLSDIIYAFWFSESCCWDKTKERSLTEVHLMNSSVCAGTLSAFSTLGSSGVLSWCAEASGDINTLLLALKPLLSVRVTRGNKLFPFDYCYCYMAISKRETNIQSFCCCWRLCYDVRSFFFM